MSKSAIQWTDQVWNPIAGCSRVSTGCEHCYAERMAKRLQAIGMPGYKGVIGKNGKWTGKINLIPSKLEEPLSWKKPRMVFVNSMSDLFHPNVPYEFICKVFMVMDKAERHTFQILTKRPEAMRDFLVDHIPMPPGIPGNNVWLGTSIENQAAADRRIPILRDICVKNLFLSVEPLLEATDLGSLFGIDWVIVGGESGPGARPCNIEWIRSIVRQCRAAGVPVFVKQLGSDPFLQVPADTMNLEQNAYPFPVKHKKGGDPSEWPEDLRVREFPVSMTGKE